jgi:hypothetical protein
MTDRCCLSEVPEDTSRLRVAEYDSRRINVQSALSLLREDCVVLVRKVGPDQADQVVSDVAEGLGLSDSLKLQAAFATFKGHRVNVGEYFMTVNNRNDYQFIPPHSEGNSFVNMQLASFFCYENSTDGGETILMNLDPDASHEVWGRLREKVMRGRVGDRQLSRQELLRARGLYNINLPADTLKPDDQILREYVTEFPGLTVVDVLAKPQRAHSCILDRDLYAYWDSVGSIDVDSAPQFESLLRSCGLIREPAGGLKLQELDNAANRRVWSSAVSYKDIFRSKLTVRLEPGDLIIQNNLTWTHSASNWSPGSGTRSIAACFA